MIKHFINLEWKFFIRSASFKANLVLKILMALSALYFIVIFLILGSFSYRIIEKTINSKPLVFVNQFLIFYLVIDLVIRYFLQKMPIVNIKPLLYLPIKKDKIIHFGIGKTIVSFFNILHAFFFIPFSITLIIKGYHPLSVIGWHLSIMALIYCNNFINIFINRKNSVFYTIVLIMTALGGLMYFNIFNVAIYTSLIFEAFYNYFYLAIIPVLVAATLYKLAFKYFKTYFYLDAGLSKKEVVGKTDTMNWLNRFGSISIFLKNDIKLIKRNKRPKATVIMSIAFIFYGLLFFTGVVETYNGPFWRVFAGVFISGGFLFSFGQFVPSWDSAYYPLLMSQNIKYRLYLESKWYLMVVATVISTILASFYLCFGWQAYTAVFVGAIYNIGVNSHIVLWAGAYVKTPIDLSSNKKAFGDKKSFNVKSLLLTIPKLVLPIGVYAIGYLLQGELLGFILIALCGLLGFLFKNKVFQIIERIYKVEKYKTIVAYKQTN